jgi:hypothetical protein
MDPRTRNYFVLIIVLVIGLATATAIVLGSGRGDQNAPPNAEQVTGVIVKVESEGLTDVRGFTIRTDGNVDMVFVLDRLENGVAFPPGHLVEHQAASSPIRVWYRTEGSVNYAIRLEDADETG